MNGFFLKENTFWYTMPPLGRIRKKKYYIIKGARIKNGISCRLGLEAFL